MSLKQQSHPTGNVIGVKKKKQQTETSPLDMRINIGMPEGWYEDATLGHHYCNNTCMYRAEEAWEAGFDVAAEAQYKHWEETRKKYLNERNEP
jgi:hypothetical protein